MAISTSSLKYVRRPRNVPFALATMAHQPRACVKEAVRTPARARTPRITTTAKRARGRLYKPFSDSTNNLGVTKPSKENPDNSAASIHDPYQHGLDGLSAPHPPHGDRYRHSDGGEEEHDVHGPKRGHDHVHRHIVALKPAGGGSILLSVIVGVCGRPLHLCCLLFH